MPAGPGKYQGEPARTFLVDDWAAAGQYDEVVGDADNGDGAALFRGGSASTNDTLSAALEYGYTLDEVEEAEWELEGTLGGVILRWDSQGFVTSTLYPYGDELYTDWRSIEAEYAQDADEHDDCLYCESGEAYNHNPEEA